MDKFYVVVEWVYGNYLLTYECVRVVECLVYQIGACTFFFGRSESYKY